MRLRIWARIARRPIDCLAIVATGVVIVIIIVNAVFLQTDSSSSRRAAGDAREIRKFLRVENRDIQSAIGRVRTIFGWNPPR
jgi:type II secretory pathway pseudopilin PulG